VPLFWLSLAFLAGIVVSDWSGWPWPAWCTLGAVGLAFWPVVRRLQAWPRIAALGRVQRPLKIPPILLLVLFAAGGLRTQLAHPALTPTDLAFYNGRGAARITAWVTSPPEQREQSTLLRLEAEEITPAKAKTPLKVRGRIAAVLPPGAGWRYGDVLELVGQPTDPPENEDFSYKEFLARQGVSTYIAFPKAQRLGEGAGSPLYRLLYALRERAEGVLNRLFPAPEAPLLSGILLGDDSAIPAELTQAYQATGTAHIIAISGFNMAILAGLFAGLFGRLFSRWWALLAALLSMALYTLLVGAGPAVVRAAIMSGLSLIAIQIGRPGGGLNALVLTAGVMALFNPDLPWDVSFQLSFTATLGLILYASRIEGWFTGLLEKHLPPSAARTAAGPVCEYLLFTLAAQATSLPVMIYHFQRLSLSSLLANPLVLPPQPLVMVLGGLSVLGGMIFEPLGRVFAALAWPFAAYTNRVVELLAQIPGGQVGLGQTSFTWVALYYAVLLAITLGWDKVKAAAPKLRPAFVLLAAGGLAVFAWRSALAGPDGRLHLVVYNLGGQAAVLVRGPEGQAVLINGAEGTARLAAGLGRWLPPGGSRLDALVVTSTESGSIQGLPGVLEQFPPGEIYLGAALPQTASGRAMNEAILNGDVPAYSLESGQSLGLGEAQVRVLLRTDKGCALMVEMGAFRALLPGGVALEELAGENVAGPSVLLLTQADLDNTTAEEWQALGAQAVINAQAGPWVAPPDGGWVHINTDGERMWMEEGNP
jgi:competence protein ComEC